MTKEQLHQIVDDREWWTILGSIAGLALQAFSGRRAIFKLNTITGRISIPSFSPGMTIKVLDSSTLEVLR